MDGNPILAAAIFAALAGGVGFAVFTVLPDVYRAARIPVAIVAALMGGLNGWDKFGGNAPDAAQAERQLLNAEETGELAAAFKRADPLGFAAYVAQVQSAMVSGEVNGERAALAAFTLQNAAEARLQSRPLEDIAAYYHLRRDELLAWRNSNPAGCRAIFFGESLAAPLLSNPDIAARRLALFTRAFEPSSVAPHASMSDAEFEMALVPVHERVSEIVGADVDMLAVETDTTGREARACEVMATFFDQLANSPDAGRIFTTLRQSQHQPS